MARILNKSNRVFVLIFSVMTVSCYPIFQYRHAFNKKYCFGNEKSRLENKIKLKGYYHFYKMDPTNLKNLGSTYYDCVFYENGIFIKNLNLHLGSVFTEDFYKQRTEWGTYKVIGDTIKTNFVDSPNLVSASRSQIWFVIIDSITIKTIASVYGKEISNEDLNSFKNNPYTMYTSLGSFKQIDSLPNYNKSWLISKGWFWCDKQKYKEWKKTNK